TQLQHLRPQQERAAHLHHVAELREREQATPCRRGGQARPCGHLAQGERSRITIEGANDIEAFGETAHGLAARRPGRAGFHAGTPCRYPKRITRGKRALDSVSKLVARYSQYE